MTQVVPGYGLKPSFDSFGTNFNGIVDVSTNNTDSDERAGHELSHLKLALFPI